MPTYEIFELQPSDPATSFSLAACINAIGVAGGATVPNGELDLLGVGTTWPSPASPQSIGSPFSYIFDINDGGFAVGVFSADDTPTQHPFLLKGGVVVDLVPTLPVGSSANGLNNDGLVVGFSGIGAGMRGFVYDSFAQTAPVVIPPLPGRENSLAKAVNSSGAVFGYSGTSSENHAILFAGGKLVDLGAMAFVEDINDSGIATGSLGKPFPAAFRAVICDTKLVSPSFTEIPLPPGGFVGSHGSAINNKGDVVGTTWTEASYDIDSNAYVFTGGVSTDLNTLIPAGSGWKLRFANDINDNGQIVGDGSLNGQRRAFLLNPTPPSPPSDPCQAIRDELANISSSDFKSPADFKRAFLALQKQLLECERTYGEPPFPHR